MPEDTNTVVLDAIAKLNDRLDKLDAANQADVDAAKLKADEDEKAALEAARLEAEKAAELKAKEEKERLEIDRITKTAVDMSSYDKDAVLTLKMEYETGETTYDQFREKLPTLAIHPKPVVAPERQHRRVLFRNPCYRGIGG